MVGWYWKEVGQKTVTFLRGARDILRRTGMPLERMEQAGGKVEITEPLGMGVEIPLATE